ncbi:hypothetical protein H5410_062251 [Solanum commersonii]|uniref:Uncharacterized protein n=1 Tax=Solanum commersonii TaxID=4109 RepID=A0A9J5WAB3_SOLCO|nr:hypothetical protein H5410_062251 [Solanum commersonii]
MLKDKEEFHNKRAKTTRTRLIIEVTIFRTSESRVLSPMVVRQKDHLGPQIVLGHFMRDYLKMRQELPRWELLHERVEVQIVCMLWLVSRIR